MTDRATPPLELLEGAARSAALEKVEMARRAVLRAEEALRATLETIESGLRADKVTVSAAVRTAFEDLSRAKHALGELEALVVQGELPPKDAKVAAPT